MNIAKKYGADCELIWADRKRFFGLPLSFTRYQLVRKPGAWFKIFSDIGFLYSVLDEVNLYRICDITFKQSLIGKILNTGVVVLYSNDETKPMFVLKNIKNPYQVRDMISTYVEEQRKLYNINLTEYHRHK